MGRRESTGGKTSAERSRSCASKESGTLKGELEVGQWNQVGWPREGGKADSRRLVFSGRKGDDAGKKTWYKWPS